MKSSHQLFRKLASVDLQTGVCLRLRYVNYTLAAIRAAYSLCNSCHDVATCKFDSKCAKPHISCYRELMIETATLQISYSKVKTPVFTNLDCDIWCSCKRV